MQTRRQFLRHCSVAAATAAVIPSAVLGRNPVAPALAKDWPGFAEFHRQVNTSFRLRTGARTVELVLAKAAVFSAVTTGAKIPGQEDFSLLFQGPAQSPLTQNTYALEHPKLRSLSIFIVPVGLPGTEHCHYEAIFNRPANAAELARQLSQAPRRVQKC